MREKLRHFTNPHKAYTFNTRTKHHTFAISIELKRIISTFFFSLYEMVANWKKKPQAISPFIRMLFKRSFRGRPFNSRGKGWVISGHQQFFYSILVGRIFFPFFPISFLLQLCCTQFFPDKSFQEIFFKSPIPPQELNDRLLIVESITLSLF